jgi:hypothetical protein
MNDKELLNATIKQLDYWIKVSEEQEKTFRENNLTELALNSKGLAQAYWNVKQFIEVNKAI